MKDFSFFILKNSLGAKMRRGFRGSCNGDASTSTLNQQLFTDGPFPDHSSPVLCDFPKVERQKTRMPTRPVAPTLEEMILQLDLEERAAARRAKIDHDERRMSCVNNTDILRSARNAMLNQYPRFSLDGKDAMYRSSFVRKNLVGTSSSLGLDVPCLATRSRFVGGERVVWCKPGVVARLMGLDAVPVPLKSRRKEKKKTKKQNDFCQGMETRENVRPRKANGHCDTEVGWPMRRHLQGRNL